MSRGRAQALAIGGALAVFLILLLALRLRSWLPFVGAALAYLGLLWACRPGAGPAPRSRPGPADVVLPQGVSRDDYLAAVDALERARHQLSALAAEAPPADAPLIGHMAELVEAIRLHHLSNPAHTPRTRPFVRHTLGRMVAAVAGYLDLVRRAEPGPDDPGRDDRLAGISRRIQGFVPALERIDRACIEDDLLALEISVEVLDEQLGRTDGEP